MKQWNIGKTLFYLFFPLVIGGLVGFFISGNIDYTSLNQPPFAHQKYYSQSHGQFYIC